MLNFTIGKSPAGQEPWRARIATCAKIQVGTYRQRGDSPATIRDKVIKGAREALSQARNDEMIEPTMTRKPDGSGMQSDYRLSGGGMFRYVMLRDEVPCDDPIVAESLMAIVQATLDEELGGATG